MRSLLRYTIDGFLFLPLGGLLAMVWANVAPERYFSFAHPLAFWVNDVAMVLFFALITQEVLEELMPGGALHGSWRWPLPLAAAAGSILGAAFTYLAYVGWKYELLLNAGWPVAAAIDIAAVYVLARIIFRRHPAVAFVLVVAIAVDIVGLAVVGSRQHLGHVDTGGVTMMLVAIGLAATMRILDVQSFWPYVIVCGPLSWWAMHLSGIHSALALVPIMPFVKHTPRSLALFEVRPHTAHHSMTHFEHVFRYPVHVVLFLFGLVNTGVLLAGYGAGTWALLAASLIGKPVGLLAGTVLGVAFGLHLPRGCHWRDLGIMALATAGGFAFALFFATALYPPGAVLAELKLGVILSGIGVPLTIVAARLARVGRFQGLGPTRRQAASGLAVAGGLLLTLVGAPAAAAQQATDASATFQRNVDAYLALRQLAREGVAPEHIIDPRIREISRALLAARIRSMRAEAREGDVFSHPMSVRIRDALHRAFDGQEVDIMLSRLYGEDLPSTTSLHLHDDCEHIAAVPPVEVLAALPPVPGVLGYRLVGVDIALWDEEAAIVIDVVRDALPPPRIWDFLDVSSGRALLLRASVGYS